MEGYDIQSSLKLTLYNRFQAVQMASSGFQMLMRVHLDLGPLHASL